MVLSTNAHGAENRVVFGFAAGLAQQLLATTMSHQPMGPARNVSLFATASTRFNISRAQDGAFAIPAFKGSGSNGGSSSTPANALERFGALAKQDHAAPQRAYPGAMMDPSHGGMEGPSSLSSSSSSASSSAYSSASATSSEQYDLDQHSQLDLLATPSQPTQPTLAWTVPDSLSPHPDARHMHYYQHFSALQQEQQQQQQQQQQLQLQQQRLQLQLQQKRLHQPPPPLAAVAPGDAGAMMDTPSPSPPTEKRSIPAPGFGPTGTPMTPYSALNGLALAPPPKYRLGDRRHGYQMSGQSPQPPGQRQFGAPAVLGGAQQFGHHPQQQHQHQQFAMTNMTPPTPYAATGDGLLFAPPSFDFTPSADAMMS